MAGLTLETFRQAQERSAGKPYPTYVKNLKAAGVARYEVSVANHLTKVWPNQGEPFDVPGHLPELVCSNGFQEAEVKAALAGTQTGLSDYPTFMAEIADAGVHHYVADLAEMKVTYYGKDRATKYEEAIPEE